MTRSTARREKWTPSFDADLKAFLVNPYGHTDAKDNVAYVHMLRRRSRKGSDPSFLDEIRSWQRSGSS